MTTSLYSTWVEILEIWCPRLKSSTLKGTPSFKNKGGQIETILPTAVARQDAPHVEVFKIFEPRRVPVILRGEYGEINKFEKLKQRFVEIATALIFFVSFSIKGKSDPSGAFEKKVVVSLILFSNYSQREE